VDKYLVAVGVNDELVAHLRLLLRRLSAVPGAQNWVWGNEDNADLFFIGLDTYAGQMARDRAGGRGRRCAIVHFSEPLRQNELRCAPPFSTSSIANVLSAAANPAAQSEPLKARHEPPKLNLGEFEDEGDHVTSITAIPSDGLSPDAASGLEELFRNEHDSRRFVPETMQIRADTTIEETKRLSKRSDNYASFEPGDLDISARTAVKNDTLRDRWPLAKYLEGNLLGGPASIALPGAPELALDPKNRVFYSPATTVQQLIEYCTQTLVQSDWHPLTSVELQGLRTMQYERPYSHLVWLSAWLESKGRLAPHLSPGADFRLKVQPDIDDGAPGHKAIAEALIVPGRLHVIAQSSGASMNDVIDLINAYDAIGWIEAVRSRPPLPPSATRKPGLLGKLGKPFRRG
jgi:hypothetical protein